MGASGNVTETLDSTKAVDAHYLFTPSGDVREVSADWKSVDSGNVSRGYSGSVDMLKSGRLSLPGRLQTDGHAVYSSLSGSLLTSTGTPVDYSTAILKTIGGGTLIVAGTVVAVLASETGVGVVVGAGMVIAGESLIGSAWADVSAEDARAGIDRAWTTQNDSIIRVARHVSNAGIVLGVGLMAAPALGAIGGALGAGMTAMFGPTVTGALGVAGLAAGIGYSAYDIGSHWSQEDPIDRAGRIGIHLAGWLSAGIAGRMAAAGRGAALASESQAAIRARVMAKIDADLPVEMRRAVDMILARSS